MKILYTNADQFVNKRDNLQLFIDGDEPDIIIIAYLKFLQLCLMHCYHYLGILPISTLIVAMFKKPLTRQCDVGIYINNHTNNSRKTFPSNFEEHLWISLKFPCSDVLSAG